MVQYKFKVDKQTLRVSVGPKTDYLQSQIDAIVEQTERVYIDHGLFPSLPKTQEAYHSLSKDMRIGLDKRLIITASLEGNENFRPSFLVGGCMIAIGTGGLTFFSTIGSSNSPLPTTWSLDFSIPAGHPLERLTLAQCACFTRFYIVDRIPLETKRAVAIAIYSLMALSLPKQIEHTILDTHLPEIEKTLTNYYGGAVLVAAGESRETDQCKNSLLHHHYGPLLPQIRVIGFDSKVQREVAGRQIKKLVRLE